MEMVLQVLGQKGLEVMGGVPMMEVSQVSTEGDILDSGCNSWLRERERIN